MKYRCIFCRGVFDENELYYEAHSCLERRYADGEEEWDYWWEPRCPVCGDEVREIDEEDEDDE